MIPKSDRINQSFILLSFKGNGLNNCVIGLLFLTILYNCCFFNLLVYYCIETINKSAVHMIATLPTRETKKNRIVT